MESMLEPVKIIPAKLIWSVALTWSILAPPLNSTSHNPIPTFDEFRIMHSWTTGQWRWLGRTEVIVAVVV